MLLNEAKKKLKEAGFRLVENESISVESVVRYIGKNFNPKVETMNVQGNDVTVFKIGRKYVKVVEGDDFNVYLTFLTDAGVPSGEPSVEINSLADIDEVL